MKRLSVILCTRNRSASLAEALESLCACRVPEGWEAEIVVVDNGSSDATRKTVEDWQSRSPVPMQYVHEPIAGLSRARNAGLRRAAGEWVAFTDDDCVAAADWLEQLASAFESWPQAVGFFGRVLPVETEDAERRVAVKSDVSPQMYQFPCNPIRIGHGNNMTFRRSAVEEAGFFDEALGAGGKLRAGEDLDMAYRLLRRGGILRYEPRCVIYHKARESVSQVQAAHWRNALGLGACLGRFVLEGDTHAVKCLLWFLNSLPAAMLRSAFQGAPQELLTKWLYFVGVPLGVVRRCGAPYVPAEPPASHGPRLLIISPLAPFPVDDGRKRRHASIIRALAKSFAVTLVAFDDLPSRLREAMAGEGMREIVLFDRNAARGRRRAGSRWLRHLDYWFSLSPWFVREREDECFSAWLLESARTPWDAVFVFNLPITGNLRPWLARWRRRGIPVVVDQDDYDSRRQWRLVKTLPAGAERIKQWVEWLRIYLYEKRWLPRFSQFWLCQDADVQAMARRGLPNAKCVANTIDLPAVNGHRGEFPKWDFIFVGMMGYIANVDGVKWFVEEIWPRIRSRRPQATFAVVGRAAGKDILTYDKRDGISVTGAVPDVAEYLRTSRIAVVPIRLGGGTRIKALEAFAWSLPVVSTPIGIEGLDVENGKQALVAESADDFASACLRLLEEENLRQELGRRGRAHVEAHHTQEAMDARVAQLIPSRAQVSSGAAQ